jgi:flagellar biosynthesis chaperone FliJ
VINPELKKPKKDRKKQHLKRMLEECKELKHLILAIKDENAKRCPHCNEKL